MPVVTYGHEGSANCAVVGGVVYQGQVIPNLIGTYVFGDFCGQIRIIGRNGESGMKIVDIASLPWPITSIGTDANAELLVVTFGGPILRLIEGKSGYFRSAIIAPTDEASIQVSQPV